MENQKSSVSSIKKERNSNFELLRIVAMLLIVVFHAVYFGVRFENVSVDMGGGTNRFFSYFIKSFCGGVGNYCFMLISAWFVCEASFSVKRVFSIWRHVFFYSALIGLIFFVTKIPTIGLYDKSLFESAGFDAAAKSAGKIDLIRSFLPILMGNNWFATCYIVFYLFLPVLNKLLSVMDKKLHLYTVILMTVIGTIISFVPGQGILHPTNFYYFVTAYFVSSYIKKYDPPVLQNSLRNILLAVVLCAAIGVWDCTMHFLSERHGFFQKISRFTLMNGSLNKFPIFLASVLLFAGFSKLKIKTNRFINSVASATFGVYLIHVSGLFKIFVWHKILKCDLFAASSLYPLYILAASLIVFSACAVIDLFVYKPLEKLFWKK